nr:hypothetical protein CFP56_16532 [Quercus suber]
MKVEDAAAAPGASPRSAVTSRKYHDVHGLVLPGHLPSTDAYAGSLPAGSVPPEGAARISPKAGLTCPHPGPYHQHQRHPATRRPLFPPSSDPAAGVSASRIIPSTHLLRTGTYHAPIPARLHHRSLLIDKHHLPACSTTLPPPTPRQALSARHHFYFCQGHAHPPKRPQRSLARHGHSF